jgi:protein SCO1/2
MVRIIAAVSTVAIIALLGGVWFVSRDTGGDAFAQCRTSAVAGGAGAIGGPFTLIDENNQTVTEQDVITEPTLIYFGYTFCPDACPFDASRNAAAVEILEEQGISTTPVFISVDPDRDTPEVLKEWTDYLQPKMLGLTGTSEQLKAAARAYKSYYKINDSDDEFYLVDHSTFSYLMLPEHGFVEFFRRDIEAEAMAEQIACFVNNA